MAIFHLHAKIIGRSSGRSSVAAAAYRAGENLHNDRDGLTHNFTHKTGVVHTEIMLAGNAPVEWGIRSTLWNAVEKSEKRRDAQTAREVEMSLPREFSLAEQIDLAREYIRENFVNEGMCADFTIHDKSDDNPHAHVMLTTRFVDESGFGGKNRDWNDVSLLEKWRENWAEKCNKRLAERGFDVRIDHRSFEAQGIDCEPTVHEWRESARKRQNCEIRERNNRREPSYVVEKINALKTEQKWLDERLNWCSEKTREVMRLERRAKEMEQRLGEIRDERGRAYFTRIYGVVPEFAHAEIVRDKERAAVLKVELQGQENGLIERKKEIETELKEKYAKIYTEDKNDEKRPSLRGFLRSR